MSHHTEPFTGAELRKFLEDNFEARKIRHVGSHVAMELPDGRILRCMDDKSTVTKALMRWNAKVLGVPYTELRRRIAPIQNRGKPRCQTTPKRQRTVSKREAISSIEDLIGDAQNLKQEIYSGDRDPVVYRRIHDAARSARRSLCRNRQPVNR